MPRRAVFLDRDGVLFSDCGPHRMPTDAEIFPYAAAALRRLSAGGLTIIVVSNQPIVARGLAREADVVAFHDHVAALLRAQGAIVERFYFCPHHPRATLETYRVACDCRKPRPGLLVRAAEELGLDLHASFLVGDRPSDIAAGARAGCRTILVQTGMHDAPPIESPDDFCDARPEHVCVDLSAAADLILREVSRKTSA